MHIYLWSSWVAEPSAKSIVDQHLDKIGNKIRNSIRNPSLRTTNAALLDRGEKAVATYSLTHGLVGNIFHVISQPKLGALSSNSCHA
jgi:hypothetical protein